MFIVRVSARAKDGAREQFLQVLQQQIEEVPKRFPLCCTYRACVDAADLQAFLVYEEWVSREAYVEFFTSRYVRQVMSQLGPLMGGLGLDDDTRFAARACSHRPCQHPRPAVERTAVVPSPDESSCCGPGACGPNSAGTPTQEHP